jgi:hypothetical protein
MIIRVFLGVTIAFCVAAFAQTPAVMDVPYQVTYASNLGVGDSVINISNTGASGAGLASGTSAAATGALCANIYVFTPDEQIVACCSCPVTPDGLVSLSAQKDLISNTLTQKVAPASIVIKMVGTLPVGGSCANSASAIGTATMAKGLVAWGTALHANTSPTGGFAVTETAFTPATLAAGETARLAYTCGFVFNQGGGNGVCASCRFGGLGSVRQ